MEKSPFSPSSRLKSNPRFPAKGLQRFAYLCMFLLVSGAQNLLFADYLWRTDIYGLKYALLLLNFILFFLTAFVFCNSLFGFLSLHWPWNHSGAQNPLSSDPLPSTVILFPIYNEDVNRVMAGIETTYRSLSRTDQLRSFDIFILSDSTHPEQWIQEEIAWFNLVRLLNAQGHIHYRHRRENRGMKSGNISEFLEQWGKRYRYMIVFDADSLMQGETVVQMVRTLEAHPRIGILQTVPGMIRGETLFSRMQQIMDRLYSRVYTAGVNFWQQSEGNYWGHNAVIRVQPFMENCRLPHLPWREPLGGQIFSHDFVEAALMRKAGYEVRLADDLEGSYEEGPANLLESVNRHRRWCQGNLQHFWLLFSPELPLLNRCHFLLGILSYTSSLLWLLFLVFSTLVVIQFERSNLTLISTSGFTRFFDLSLSMHGLLIFGFVFLLLLSPKLFSLLDLYLDADRRKAFGGGWSATMSVLLETLLSMITAPIYMFWHSLFVVTIPLGKGVRWVSQCRTPERGLSWREAAATHGWLTAIGAVWGILANYYNLTFFLWLLPITIPLVFSIPINVLLSSATVGKRLCAKGIFLTPEEIQRPRELEELAESEHRLEALAKKSNVKSYAALAVADPYVNALHISLQQDTLSSECQTVSDEALQTWLKNDSPETDRALTYSILLDEKCFEKIHHQLWRQPESELADHWQDLLISYTTPRHPNLLSHPTPPKNSDIAKESL